MKNLFQTEHHIAARHIKRLKEEKKLQNINTRQSPVYVPMPGYYGKPEVEDTVK